MHELSITQNIIDIGRNYAEGKRVLAVTVEIGRLSGVIPESVEFCFEACSKGTPMEGARLAIISIPGQARCRTCGKEQQVGSYYEACSACGDFGLEILAGTELRVKQLEVE
ncbi:MAG: hydrogenase maturation nickel metallochaperone HypA [Syntrophotaleaceae bacterium]